jgi:hypothetical protein
MRTETVGVGIRHPGERRDLVMAVSVDPDLRRDDAGWGANRDDIGRGDIGRDGVSRNDGGTT